MMQNKRKAIFVGSFDPFTNAHLDIVKRASNIFDEVLILVSNNFSKNNWFSIEERKEMIINCLKEENVTEIKVEVLEKETVASYAKKNNYSYLIRGVRSIKDWEAETFLSENNYFLNSNLETIILISRVHLQFISSNLCKEISFYNGQLTNLVCPFIETRLREKAKIIQNENQK